MSWHGLHAWHPSELTRDVLEYSAWAIAVAWCVRVRGLVVNLHKIADLSEMKWDLCPVSAPSLTVVVPV